VRKDNLVTQGVYTLNYVPRDPLRKRKNMAFKGERCGEMVRKIKNQGRWKIKTINISMPKGVTVVNNDPVETVSEIICRIRIRNRIWIQIRLKKFS
jgi:hypothetical protein